jgi:hypothetical protein
MTPHTNITGRVGGAARTPLIGTRYATAKNLKLGDVWREPGYVLTDEDLAGRSVEGMLLAGDIVAVAGSVAHAEAPKKGRKR